MKTFPVKKLAHEWDQQHGGTDGCEAKAYLAGVAEALTYAMTLCISGSTPSMIRFVLARKLAETLGEENP